MITVYENFILELNGEAASPLHSSLNRSMSAAAILQSRKTLGTSSPLKHGTSSVSSPYEAYDPVKASPFKANGYSIANSSPFKSVNVGIISRLVNKLTENVNYLLFISCKM